MDLLAAEFEGGLVEEQAVAVLKVKRVAPRHFDLRDAALLPALKRSSNDMAGITAFVNGKLKVSLGLAGKVFRGGANVFNLLDTSIFGLYRFGYIGGFVFADTIQEVRFANIPINNQNNLLAGRFLSHFPLQ